VDVAAAPDDASCTKNGLCSKVLRVGVGGTHPKATSTVIVHYSGWTTDGKLFDSSILRGEPAKFPLNMVIPGWTQGVQLMVQGEKRRFWIPEKLAYKGRKGAPPGMLVFDIELIDIE
jgi:peptidylprolyl isomerase